jgi:hypothetical protein
MPLTIALFPNEGKAEAAVHELERQGLDQVGLAAHETWARQAIEMPGRVGSESKEGLKQGGLWGTLLGGVAGVASAAITGGASLVLVGILAGAGVGGLTGLLTGATSAGISNNEDEAYYVRALQEGGIVLVVRSEESQVKHIGEILQGFEPQRITVRPDTHPGQSSVRVG